MHITAKSGEAISRPDNTNSITSTISTTSPIVGKSPTELGSLKTGQEGHDNTPSRPSPELPRSSPVDLHFTPGSWPSESKSVEATSSSQPDPSPHLQSSPQSVGSSSSDSASAISETPPALSDTGDLPIAIATKKKKKPKKQVQPKQTSNTDFSFKSF